MKLKVGQIVGRKSYQCDILFRIVSIHETGKVDLYGEDVRLMADAPIEDIVVISNEEQVERKNQEKVKEENCYYLFRQDYRLLKQRNEYEGTSGYAADDSSYFELRGRVLHLDGDPLYLRKCIDLYEKIGIPVYGVHIDEKEMPHQINSLLEMVRPDILVITGHDGFLKSKGNVKDVKAYRHSKHFAETVREARKVYPHFDQLVIFAGACQSHFDSLIKAGANFASSPERINIHALDPVYIVAKISLTPFTERVNLWELLKNTITGEKGIGGIETRGLLRRGMPYYKEE